MKTKTEVKLIEKIADAKTEIKLTKVKKQGKNKLSNYEYFTPTQVEFLVAQACQNQRILTKFDLVRDQLGIFGRLTIFDLDSDESMVYDMASAIPEIKATNVTQQVGGCATFTERYLKMSAFGITDNNLDFDAGGEKVEVPAKSENKIVKNKEAMVEDWQIKKIESLLIDADIDDSEKQNTKKIAQNLTRERALKCIKYLEGCQKKTPDDNISFGEELSTEEKLIEQEIVDDVVESTVKNQEEE